MLTTGVGIETAPVFSPDGQTVAFTGDYDGNTDVFTIPAGGGIPFRVTYHPAPDFAVGWSPDGTQILFRSTRDSHSRYTQLYTIPARGGVAKALPLPMAYQGAYSADAKEIAYSPLSPGFGFNYTSYVAWGNYHGGLAGSIWITTLPGLDSVQIPHEKCIRLLARLRRQQRLLPLRPQRSHHHLQIRSGKQDRHRSAEELRLRHPHPLRQWRHAGLRSARRDLPL